MVNGNRGRGLTTPGNLTHLPMQNDFDRTSTSVSILTSQTRDRVGVLVENCYTKGNP